MADSASRPTPTPLGLLLRRNLLAATLIFLVLELWRPLFFLTDDNLDGGYPFLMEVGRHLLHGQSPFISHHLFGGDYNLLRDPTYFSWHPAYLLVSLLAGTPLHLAIIDVAACLMFMLATAGFVCLADFLRRDGAAEISDGWLTFFTLSFVYSMIALATSASWLTFACNQSALPWLALGVLHRRAARSFLLIALFTTHEVLGGHLAPTISTTLFFGLFAVPRGAPAPELATGTVLRRRHAHGHRRSPAPAAAGNRRLCQQRARGRSLGGGYAGLQHPGRFVSPSRCFSAWRCGGRTRFIPSWSTRTAPTSSRSAPAPRSGACCPRRPAGAAGARWKKRSSGLILVAGLLVCRPAFLTAVLTHVPVLRSLRWPFRELLQFQFFVHLFLVLRRPAWTPLVRWRLALFSTAIYVLPLFTYRLPPTLINSMSWDRRLVLSGRDQVYWAKVRPLLRPGDRVAVIIPRALFDRDRFDIPYSLLGTYNYACVDGIVNVSGYSPTAPQGQLYSHVAYYPFGACIPEERAALLREHPGLKFITLESLQPVKIVLSSATGPSIDLTPFIPHELDPPPPPVPPSGDAAGR